MPPDFDPNNLQLALVLTAAGATVSAGVIATLIQLSKKIPVIGPWIDAKREPGVAVLASAALVAVAYLGTTAPADISIASGFAAFLAFLGIAKLSTAAYDVGVTVKASVSGTGS